MVKREKCPDCQGRGQVEIAGTQHTYEACDGKKYVIRTGSNLPCTLCRGKGTRGFFKRCERCQGTGFVSG